MPRGRTRRNCVPSGYDARMRQLARMYALLVGLAGLVAVGVPIARAILRRAS